MVTRLSRYKPFLLLVVLTATACSPEEQETRTDTMRGKTLFEANCAQCHGATAEDAGPASIELNPPPPTLRQLASSNNGVFPRDYVMATIDGLSRHNELVAGMPEFGAGDLGPLIQIEENGLSTPIPADLVALANYLEVIQD